MDIKRWFGCHGWWCQEVDSGIWHSQFVTEDENRYNLYTTISGDFVHFAVSPFVPQPITECQQQAYQGLLRLNQQMRMAYFAVDDEGDINLMLDMPLRACTYELFVQALERLRGYTELLAPEVQRSGHLPGYQSRHVNLSDE